MTRNIRAISRPYAAPAMSSNRTEGVKRLLPRTLLGRSVLIIVMPLILVQLVATWVFYDRHWDTVSRRLAYAVAGEIAIVIEAMPLADTDLEQYRLFWRAATTSEIDYVFRRGARL